MKKKIITLALVLILLLTANALPASAAGHTQDGLPQSLSERVVGTRWESTNLVSPSISISGRRITAAVVIIPKSQATSSVGTLYLEKRSANGWTPVNSWSINAVGTVSMSKTHLGTPGCTYRTRVVVTTGQDFIDMASGSKTVGRCFGDDD